MTFVLMDQAGHIVREFYHVMKVASLDLLATGREGPAGSGEEYSRALDHQRAIRRHGC